MFRIVTKKKFAKMEQEAYCKAIASIIEILKKKDSIYLETVTLKDAHTIQNCAFLGSKIGVLVEKEEKVTRSCVPGQKMEFRDGKRVA